MCVCFLMFPEGRDLSYILRCIWDGQQENMKLCYCLSWHFFQALLFLFPSMYFNSKIHCDMKIVYSDCSIDLLRKWPCMHTWKWGDPYCLASLRKDLRTSGYVFVSHPDWVSLCRNWGHLGRASCRVVQVGPWEDTCRGRTWELKVFTLQKPVGPGPEIQGPLCDLNGGSHGTEFSFI